MQAAAWAALNGVGLALVMPCVQAILAEVYYARQRGRAFGLLFTISALGGMFFNFIAVTFGDREINGLPVRALHAASLFVNTMRDCFLGAKIFSCLRCRGALSGVLCNVQSMKEF